MKNVFDFNRFGKFFTYELNNAKASCGLSLLILGLMPAIILSGQAIFSFIFTHQFQPVGMEMKKVMLTICLFILVISLPVRLYGKLTEKKKGSDWLMIPASGLEKFLAMIIIVCIVLPLCFFVLFYGSDSILSVVFPNFYGSSLTSVHIHRFSLFGDYGNDFSGLIAPSRSGVIVLLLASLFINMLSFTLGAICFKRGKGGKTILCYFALSIILSILLVCIFGHGGSINADDFESFIADMTPQKAQNFINTIINVPLILFLGGLLTAIYFRIKTIKH